MAFSYWGPIKYSIAVLCPVFALEFSFSSKFVKNNQQKLSFLAAFVICFYIIVISMVIQWINKICWVLFFSVPNYSYIIANFYELVKPAFSAVAWYIPIVTFYPIVFKGIYMKVNDTYDIYHSVYDCGGINLSVNKEGTGPYACEMFFIKDYETGKTVKTPEPRRFETTLVVGVSGSGKTSMIFEPMIARDLEKKFFFRESAKELGYTALRTGIATLNSPYSNEYLNSNFNLNMLVPNQNKEKLYKSFMSKMILSSGDDGYLYKNVGLTYVAPDAETLDHMTAVADNFNISYQVIDPSGNSTAGLNPFVFKDPIKAAFAVSAILGRLYRANLVGNSNLENEVDAEDVALSNQAVENLVILLKLIFPKINEGIIPTLEDLLNCMNNFNLVEKMTKVLEKDADLAEKYAIQIDYFKNNFFKNSENKDEIKRQLKIPAAQIEALLRYPGVKSILCNRNKNINYDDALANGEVIFVCTRRGDLGAATQRGFGLFFLLLMQQSVLSRPGTEKTRVPHFLYIDEFTPFMTPATDDIFTLYRKYRVGSIISVQNLAQLGSENSARRQTILANSTTEVIFGNNTPEDNEWWELELGDKRKWKFSNDYHTMDSKTGDHNPGYDETYKNIEWAYTKNFKAGKVQSLKFKEVIVKTKDMKGKNQVYKGKVDFLESRYKEPAKTKTYNFTKFVQGVSNNPDNDDKKPAKFDLRNVDFSSISPDMDGPIAKNPNSLFKQKGKEDVNPIKTNSNNNNNGAIDDYNSDNN